MSAKIKALRRRLMQGRPTAWESYNALIAEHLRDGMTVLDVGCGKGVAGAFAWDEYPEITLIGLDPDPAAESNPHLDRFILLTDPSVWDLPDACADLVVSRSVLEHVGEPGAFFANLARVLKPGGAFVFLTPNRRHPALVASQLMPHRLKERFLSRTGRRDEDDVFPTYYRMNTAGELGSLAREAGLQVERLVVTDFEPVNYLDFCLPGFGLSYLHWWLNTRTGLQRWFGSGITGVLRKRE